MSIPDLVDRNTATRSDVAAALETSGRLVLRLLQAGLANGGDLPGVSSPFYFDLDAAAVSARFEDAQRAFEQSVFAADGLDLSKVRVSSPALPLLRLPLGIWFLSTSSHTLRHLNR